MKMKQVKLDNNVLRFYLSYELKTEIKILREVIEKVDQPFILNSSVLNDCFFNVYYGDSRLKAPIFEFIQKITKIQNIWEIAKEACIKDEEWGRWCNKDLTGEYYFKYTFKPKYQKILIKEFTSWIETLEKTLTEMEQEENNKKKEKEKRRNQYQIIETFSLIHPKGGEMGIDGYADLLLRNSITGVETRMVARNVFDFGFYTYPKRLEGDREVFNNEKWETEEKMIHKWLYEFGPIATNIRM